MWTRILKWLGITLLVIFCLGSVGVFYFANIFLVEPAVKPELYFPKETKAERELRQMIEKIDAGNSSAKLKAYFALCDLPQGCNWKNNGKDYLVISVTNERDSNKRTYKLMFSVINVELDGRSITTCVYVPDRDVTQGKSILVYCAPFETEQYNEQQKFDKVCVELEYRKLFRVNERKPVSATVCQKLTK